MRCIGIDIGSSSIKGGILGLETAGVEHTEKTAFPDPVPGLAPGFHEVDVDAIVQGTRNVLVSLLRKAPDARALRVSSQMGGVVLVDTRGAPLTRYLSWRDQRSLQPASGSAAPLLQELREAWTDAQFEQLGKELKPGSTTALLHWLARHGKLPPGATPVTIGDHVIAALCEAPPRMHRTHAIGLIDLRAGAWHHAAFAAARIDGLSWPALASEDEPVGQVALDGRRLDCFAAIGDQQAALFGIDLGPSELSINASTGSQVSQITQHFRPGDCQSRCWFGGQFLNTVTHIPAGRSLAVLESLLTELPRAAGVDVGNSWKLIAAATEASGGAGGLAVDLGFFASAMGDRGRIAGITTENLSAGNLFCAAFDFMADSYLACSRRLAATPSWDRLAVSGGLVQAFPALRHRIADRFHLPMREVPEQEETLTGLLKLARVAGCRNSPGSRVLG
jgi:sugar (pentulose or hexulose) kinase